MARVVILGAGIARQKPRGSGRVAERGLELDTVEHLGRGRADVPQQVTFPLAPVYRRQGIEFRQARAVAIRPEGG